MYSDKLNNEKIAFKKDERPCSMYDRKKIENVIDSFCKKDDLIGVPTDIMFNMFDEFCEENGYPKFSHVSLGRVFREHFGLTRKKARKKGGKLCWIYIPKED